MELQHVNVKLLLEDAGQLDLSAIVPIFHDWMRDQLWEELLLDIADYSHVYQGPGVVLIGHEGNYSVDNTDGRLGVRYNRKAALGGSNHDRLVQGTRAALNACRALGADPRLAGKVRFNGREIELFINDRLIAPNDEKSREAAASDFHNLFTGLFEKGEYALSFEEDSQRRLSATAKTSRAFGVAELLGNLAGNVCSGARSLP